MIEAINTTQPEGFTSEDLQLPMLLGKLAGTAIARTRIFTTLRNASVAFQEVIQERYRLGMDPSAMELLQAYRWPGNVRELQNVIARAVVLSPGPEITVTDLPAEIRPSIPGPAGPTDSLGGIEGTLPLAEAVKAFRRAQIRQALEKAGGNREQAASLLGLAPPNLSRLMKNIGLR